MIGRSISLPRYLRAVALLCSLAIAGAQQTQPAANVTTVPRLVHFAGTFHLPADSAGSPVPDWNIAESQRAPLLLVHRGTKPVVPCRLPRAS